MASLSEFIKIEDYLVLHDINFVSYEDIRYQIQDFEIERQGILSKFRMMAVMHPSELFKNEEEFILDAASKKVNEVIDEYDTVIRKLSSLMLVQREIERYAAKHNCSNDEAFNNVVIDKFKDLREQIDATKITKEMK